MVNGTMNQRLTENERVLLSTYLDNELARADLERAESLLASSPEAQSYLQELRAVGTLSTEALALPAGLAATAATTIKLTGPAIATAAKGMSLAKGSLLSGWGMTGLVGVAATAVVAVTIVLSGGDDPSGTSQRVSGSQPSQAGVASQAEAPPTALALDSTALIVPEMTPTEMVAFAVEGTLPIDEARKRFITLVTKGRDSLSIEVHNRPPKGMVDIMRDIERLRPAEYRGIDSLARVVRLAVLQGKDGGTVVCRDIGRLRLEVAQLLGRLPEQEIPAAVQVRIRQAENVLARTFTSSGLSFDENHAVDFDNENFYVSLQGDDPFALNSLPDAPLSPPRELTVVFDNTPRCYIAPLQMNELRTLASTPRVSVSTAAVASNEAPEVQVGAGGAPRSTRSTRRSTVTVPSPQDEGLRVEVKNSDNTLTRPDEKARIYQMQLQNAAIKLKKAQERIDAVEKKLRRAEEESSGVEGKQEGGTEGDR
jgi:hypothetical protein